MFIVIIIIILILFAINNYVYNDKDAKIFNKIPGPKTWPLVGNALDVIFKVGPVPLFYRFRTLASIHNGVYKLWELNKKHVNIYNPHDIGVVLSSPKHINKNRLYRFFRLWLNEGLLLSSGDKWQRRRKILTPAFHFNILRQFCNIFERQSKILVEKLKKKNGEVVNVMPYISSFALNSICETSMGSNIASCEDNVEKYKEAVHTIGEYFIHRLFRIWLHSDFVFKLSPLGFKQKKVLKTLHDFTMSVIRERRSEKLSLGREFSADYFPDESSENPKKRLAMLDLLLHAESEGSIDEEGIREEVDTFMFEGHDTTTLAISFCLMLLANNPNVQKLAHKEVCSILDDSAKNVSIGDLNNMNYLERCIKEALRLYPSVPFVGREIAEPINMGDYIIPAGTSCNIHVYDVHRDPKIFPNPLKFDPDRFLPENCANRHPYAYIPFSAGPRNCIGQRFAILEEKAVISLILKNFILEPVTTPDDVYLMIDIVLRSRDPIKIKFIPRMQ